MTKSETLVAKAAAEKASKKARLEILGKATQTYISLEAENETLDEQLAQLSKQQEEFQQKIKAKEEEKITKLRQTKSAPGTTPSAPPPVQPVQPAAQPTASTPSAPPPTRVNLPPAPPESASTPVARSAVDEAAQLLNNMLLSGPPPPMPRGPEPNQIAALPPPIANWSRQDNLTTPPTFLNANLPPPPAEDSGRRIVKPKRKT